LIRFNEVTGIDAYCASVPSHDEEILGLLQARNLAPSFRRERGLHGYETSLVADIEGEQVARVLYGGRNGRPHIQSFGGHAEAVAAMIRETWPDSHEVSRIDIARDYDEPEFFDRWYPVIVSIARDSNICTPCAGEWQQDPKSRTQYVGSPKSQVRLRAYEKGAQLINEFRNIPHLAAAIPPNWCRIEAQIKPNHQITRQFCAEAAPEALWGCSPFLRAIIAQIEGTQPQRVSMGPVRPPTGLEKGFHNMWRQYGKGLKALDRKIGRTSFLDLIQQHLDA